MLKYMHNTFNFIGANKARFFLISFPPSMQKHIYILQVYQVNTEVEQSTKQKTKLLCNKPTIAQRIPNIFL